MLTLRIATGALVFALGCTSNTQPEKQPAKTLEPSLSNFTASLDDGAKFEGSSLIAISLVEGQPYATVRFSGQRGPEYLSAAMYVSLDTVSTASQTVRLTREPIKSGVAHFERGLAASPLGSTKAEDGTIEFTRDSTGMITGRVNSPVASLGGQFSGRYTVECSVSPEKLGRPSAGEGILETDVDFVSSFCRPYGALRANK